MKTILKLIVLVPVGVALILLAVANHHEVMLKFDPFTNDGSEMKFPMPLFLPLFAMLMLGVVVGGIAMWISQGRHRRAARLAKAETNQLRAQMLENAH